MAHTSDPDRCPASAHGIYERLWDVVRKEFVDFDCIPVAADDALYVVAELLANAPHATGCTCSKLR